MGVQVVLKLMKPILNKGHCLTTDNFYTSPRLAEILLQHKTDMIRTMRLNKQGVPKELQQQILKRVKLSLTAKEKFAFSNGKTRRIMVEVLQNGSHKQNPELVKDYSYTMGGVDKVDQNLTNYAVIKNGEKNII
uniref:DDE_Tnp_1_7 domain-containing protein n=1 Tax=Anopheles funestus TaxID=62324 RepID=A0A182S095_ANOFN